MEGRVTLRVTLILALVVLSFMAINGPDVELSSNVESLNAHRLAKMRIRKNLYRLSVRRWIMETFAFLYINLNNTVWPVMVVAHEYFYNLINKSK